MENSTSAGLERRIVIGLIVSDLYLIEISKFWNPDFLQSDVARLLGSWCMEYFQKYNKSPYGEIEAIYFQKLKDNKIPKDLAEEIEEDILPSLSEEYERGPKFNFQYLLDQTKEYFRERELAIYTASIDDLLERGDTVGATALANNWTSMLSGHESSGLFLDSPEAQQRIYHAFNRDIKQVVKYPGALGHFWNDQLIRDSLVSFLAPEKRGKTFMLLDMSIRGLREGSNVAFFQAGDMSEFQQLLRISIYLTKTPVDSKYCGKQLLPVRDCWKNQIDSCERKERECNFGVFSGVTKQDVSAYTMEQMKEAFYDNPKYKPCHNCHEDYEGSVWYEEIDVVETCTPKKAQRAFDRFFGKYKNRFMLSTHANGTLSVGEIKSLLNKWERENGFVPDMIVVDYADLLHDDTGEFRHKQNNIWMGLRGLSQERHCLVLTATQADANSYKKDRLGLSNFSEDKRKYAHVTAMYGLNQDADFREKGLGIMRINKLVVREDAFDNLDEVKILQHLQLGRPYLGSFK